MAGRSTTSLCHSLILDLLHLKRASFVLIYYLYCYCCYCCNYIHVVTGLVDIRAFQLEVGLKSTKIVRFDLVD